MKWIIRTALVLALLTSANAQEVEPKADNILKEMSSYLGKLEQFSFHVDAEYDDERSGRWVEFASSSDIYVRRPDGVRSIRRGDKGDAQAFFDGQDLVIYSPKEGFYSKDSIPGDIPTMLDFANNELNLTLPVADFLFPDSYEVLTADLKNGFYVGRHAIEGIPCHHLSFVQNSGIEWQIWVEDGEAPRPRKIVIRHANEPGVPRYDAVFSNWDTTTPIARDSFTFIPPADAYEIQHHAELEVENK